MLWALVQLSLKPEFWWGVTPEVLADLASSIRGAGDRGYARYACRPPLQLSATSRRRW